MTKKGKCESLKASEEDEMEVSNLKVLYRNKERDKSSGLSSDEETTSSSLAPLPDTFAKMRNQLKKNVNDERESYEFESAGDAPEELEGIRYSLEALRKKYSLKHDTSVALKVNSANLMLDDILKNGSANRSYEQPEFFQEKAFRLKTVQETETSTTEDLASPVERCTHVAVPVVLPQTFTSLCDVPHSHCPRHSYQEVYGCVNPEKGAQISDKSQCENQRGKSLLDKIQSFRQKCKVQSVYKIMQKNNPFHKERHSEQLSRIPGIPGTHHCREGLIHDKINSCKCERGINHGQNYSKRMIFDLVESSDVSQCDRKSLERGDGRYTCPLNIKCTCATRRECTCPEVIPKCICADCTCEASELSSQKTLKSNPPPTVTVQYVQTEPEPPAEGQSSEDKEEESSPPPPSKCSCKSPEMIPFPKSHQDRKRHCVKERKLVERTDIYYFDHGNSAYYQTTDNHPVRYTECLVERTDEYATKFWAEFFGAIEIGMSFVVSFILQLYRFFFTSIIRSLTVGLLQIFSDYFFKPLLSIIFNGLIQPCLILAYNVATSLRDLCLPISQIFGFFAKEVATVFKSCRLVEVNHDSCKQSSYCGNKV